LSASAELLVIIEVHNEQIVFCLTKLSLCETQLTRSKIIVQNLVNI